MKNGSITYQENRKRGTTTVKLGSKVTEEIRKVEGGYQYCVKNSQYKGKVLPTIEAVKNSVEHGDGDDDE